jgi:hypothetical protein
MNKTLHSGKTECALKLFSVSYIMMYWISSSSGYHCFVDLIVDLSEYMYLLNERKSETI